MTTGWNSKDVKVFFFSLLFWPWWSEVHSQWDYSCCRATIRRPQAGDLISHSKMLSGAFYLVWWNRRTSLCDHRGLQVFFFLSVHNVNIYKKEPGDHPTVSPWNTHSWFSVLFTTNLGFEQPVHTHIHTFGQFGVNDERKPACFFFDSERKLDTQGEKWKQNSKHPDRPWPFWRKAAALTTLPLWVIPKHKIKSEQKTDKKKV